MMKKKTLATLLTLTMLTTAAVPVFAEEGDNRATELTYTVASTYTLTIPKTVSWKSADGAGAITITVDKAVIKPDETVNVSILNGDHPDGADNPFRMIDAKGNFLSYKIEKKEVDETVTVVKLAEPFLSVTGEQTLPASATLNVTATGTPKIAGDHTDKLTFTAAIATTSAE